MPRVGDCGHHGGRGERPTSGAGNGNARTTALRAGHEIPEGRQATCQTAGAREEHRKTLRERGEGDVTPHLRAPRETG